MWSPAVRRDCERGWPIDSMAVNWRDRARQRATTWGRPYETKAGRSGVTSAPSSLARLPGGVAGDRLAVDGEIAAGDLRPGQVALGARAGSPAECGGARGVAEESGDGVGEGGGVALGDEQPLHA